VIVVNSPVFELTDRDKTGTLLLSAPSIAGLQANQVTIESFAQAPAGFLAIVPLIQIRANAGAGTITNVVLIHQSLGPTGSANATLATIFEAVPGVAQFRQTLSVPMGLILDGGVGPAPGGQELLRFSVTFSVANIGNTATMSLESFLVPRGNWARGQLITSVA